MGNFLILFICFGAGIVLRQSGRTPVDAHKSINALIVNLLLPATALFYLHQLNWDSSLIAAAAMPWILFIMASVMFFYFGRKVGWSKEIIGTLILVAGLGNTSFVGIPMTEALKGGAAIPIAMVVDQAGSYLVMSTIGLFIASYCGVGSTHWKEVARRVITYPPFIAMALAVILIPIDFPESVMICLKRISDCLVPFAILSVGMQLSLKGIGESKAPLLAGLVFKLIVCPAIVLVFFLALGKKMTYTDHVILIEAAMGPSIGAGIIATQHELSPRLVSLLIGFGIPISIASSILINFLVVGFEL